MKNKTGRSMVYSIAIHILLLAAFIVLRGRTSEAEITVIDFSLEKTAVTEKAEIKPSPQLKPAAKTAIKPIVTDTKELFPDTTELDTTSHIETDAIDSSIIDSTRQAAITAAYNDSISRLKAAYLAANYNEIREKVNGSIVYPEDAQSRGLEGEVRVSFYVHCDGRVDNIVILKSSGHSMLDKCVVDAVKKAAPYKPSPKKVEIRLPITFRLE